MSLENVRIIPKHYLFDTEHSTMTMRCPNTAVMERQSALHNRFILKTKPQNDSE